MAINYKQVGWDTTKYINPTNMNHMDEGIKAACDKADANEAAIADVNNNLGKCIPVGYKSKENYSVNEVHTIEQDGIIIAIANSNSIATLWSNSYNFGFVISSGTKNSNSCVLPVFNGMTISLTINEGSGELMYVPYQMVNG